jgi:hypothetical protein
LGPAAASFALVGRIKKVAASPAGMQAGFGDRLWIKANPAGENLVAQ